MIDVVRSGMTFGGSGNMPFVRNDLALQSASSLSHTVLPRSVEHSGSPLLHFKYIWGLDSPKVTLLDDIAAMIRCI